MTTIYEVAAYARVSAATVSRVINGNSGVNPEMAERVREAIASLGYRPSSVARSMRTQRTGIIAVIVPDIENPFFTAVVRGIEDVGRQSGQMTVLCNTDDQPEIERGYLSLAVDQRMDGVILASSIRRVDDDLSKSRGALVPTVLIDREIAGLRTDTVMVDNVMGAREATGHLLQAGATRIACVTGPANVTTAVQRLQGYLDALADAGISRRRALYRHADYRVPGGRAAVRELLTEHRPDAFLVNNNMMTMGAVQEFGDRGIRAPDDVLLVGFDDEPWASFWRPTVSTVAQPALEVGRSAMRLLLDRIADGKRPIQRVLMQPTLQVRQSSTVPAAGHQPQ